jgi:hypothetical protein
MTDPAETIVAMIGQLAVLPREEALARVREVVAQPRRRPYNASGSLGEYGIFPECDAAPAAQPAAPSDEIGPIRIGALPTMNQDEYPGLGAWWVQLRIGQGNDEVLARVYGASPEQAHSRAQALARHGQPAASAEPVAQVSRKGFHRGSIVWTAAGLVADLPDGTNLYAAMQRGGEHA